MTTYDYCYARITSCIKLHCQTFPEYFWIFSNPLWNSTRGLHASTIPSPKDAKMGLFATTAICADGSVMVNQVEGLASSLEHLGTAVLKDAECRLVISDTIQSFWLWRFLKWSSPAWGQTSVDPHSTYLWSVHDIPIWIRDCRITSISMRSTQGKTQRCFCPSSLHSLWNPLKHIIHCLSSWNYTLWDVTGARLRQLNVRRWQSADCRFSGPSALQTQESGDSFSASAWAMIYLKLMLKIQLLHAIAIWLSYHVSICVTSASHSRC